MSCKKFIKSVSVRYDRDGKLSKVSKISLVEWHDCNDVMPDKGKWVLFRDGKFVGEGYINVRGEWYKYEGFKLSIIGLFPTHWAEKPRY